MSILSVGSTRSPEIRSGNVSEYVPPEGFSEVGSTEEAYTNGFIDWLRKGSEVVGVALTPFGGCDGLLRLADEELIEIEETRVLFFFGPNQSFDRPLSTDQELRPTRCFHQEGNWILAIELSGWGMMPGLMRDMSN